MATALTAVVSDTAIQLPPPSPTPPRYRSFSTPTTTPTPVLASTVRLWRRQPLRPRPQLQQQQQQQWLHRCLTVQPLMGLASGRLACLSPTAHTGFPTMAALTGPRQSSMCQLFQTWYQHQKKQMTKKTKKTSFSL